MSEEIAEDRLLADALEVRLKAPSLSAADALWSVGMDEPKSKSPEMEERMATLMTSHCQRVGFPFLSLAEDQQIDRVAEVMLLMKRDPSNKKATALKGMRKNAHECACRIPHSNSPTRPCIAAAESKFRAHIF